MIPEAELREIGERCGRATPGPWERDHGIIWGDGGRTKVAYSGALTHDVGTLDLIASSRTDLPRLLAAYEELRALAVELAEAIDGIRVKEVAPFVTRIVGRNKAHIVLANARAAGLLDGPNG